MHRHPLILATLLVMGTCSPAPAAPHVVTLTGPPLTSWSLVYPDGLGGLTTAAVEDTDGDGIGSLVLELEPDDPLAAMPMMDNPLDLKVAGSSGSDESQSPFLRIPGGAALITRLTGASTRTFTLGEVVTVSDGLVPDFTGVVHTNPGISLYDAFLTDFDQVPHYSGPAEVTGILSVLRVPEPGTLPLAILAAIGSYRRRRQAQRNYRQLVSA